MRISARGKANVIHDRERQTRNMSFDKMLETGWDYTVGAEPEVLHAAPDKVHLQGGWTRYDSDDRPIMSNSVTYIVTLVDGRWGMQSRFGTDTNLFWGRPKDRPVEPAVNLDHNARNAVQLVESVMKLSTIDDLSSVASIHYPLLLVEPGDVVSVADPQALRAYLPSAAPPVTQVDAIQSGATGVNVSFRASHGDCRVEGVCMVKVEAGRWGIKGASVIGR